MTFKELKEVVWLKLYCEKHNKVHKWYFMVIQLWICKYVLRISDGDMLIIIDWKTKVK